MSQNFNRGLENEYLVPYISFTTHPQSGSIIGGGTTTLTAVAAASTGIGYLNYRWYQDDVLSGGITTALSGVTTTRSYTLDYAGDNLSRTVNYKVSAEWVPDNSDIIFRVVPGNIPRFNEGVISSLFFIKNIFIIEHSVIVLSLL